MTAHMLLPDLPAYAEVKAHAAALKQASLERLFEEDDSRAEKFTLEAAGLQLDYSKHLLNHDALASLLNLATQAGLSTRVSPTCLAGNLSTPQRIDPHCILYCGPPVARDTPTNSKTWWQPEAACRPLRKGLTGASILAIRARSLRMSSILGLAAPTSVRDWSRRH